jgi:2-keto-3-deoxy-L-rhamnonate aldolase RhmA
MTPLRDRLRQRTQLVGCFQSIPSAESTEAAAFAGLDFVIIDSEHGLLGNDQIGALVRAAEATGIAPIVRLASADGPQIGRLLDAGVAGIMVAHVRSAAEAAAIAAATRYPPRGTRSAARSRATGYGRSASLTELASGARDPAIITMIEDRAGVDNSAEIAGVDGVDALFVGTSDLSMDVGAPGNAAHADVVGGVSRVCSSAEEHGIGAGLPLAADADVAAAFALGATFVATSDVFALISALERFRAGCGPFRAGGDEESG